VSIFAVLLVGATAYAALMAPLCPSENPDCSADIIFARLLASILAVVIVAGGFATLIYYLVKWGRNKRKKYAIGISLPEQKKTQVSLFIGESWLKEVLIILGLNLAVVGLPDSTLPSYLSFPLWIAVAWLPILAIRRRSTMLFKGERWQTELVVVLGFLIVAGFSVRKLIEVPYSLPVEASAVILAIWILRSLSTKYQSSRQTIDEKR
jgi:hypothetical protein